MREKLKLVLENLINMSFTHKKGSLYWFPLPYLIYGASALVASISYIIFMPETKGKKLLDKLEDMEG